MMARLVLNGLTFAHQNTLTSKKAKVVTRKIQKIMQIGAAGLF